MKESVWSKEVTLPQFPVQEQNEKTDVLIVGGGLAGLLCAYMLTKDGVDCVLIEANRICTGTTANTTAKVTSQHGLIYQKLLKQLGTEKTRLYWEANETALREICKLAAAADCEFEEKESCIYSIDSRKNLELEMEVLQRLGISAKYCPSLNLPFETKGGVSFPNQGQFHPLKFAAEICRGLKILEKTTAIAFQPGKVITNRGEIRAEKIIVATHFPILNKHGGYFLKLYQDRSYVLAMDCDWKPERMYLDESGKGLSMRRYRDKLILGGGAHRTGKSGGGWNCLENAAVRFFPEAKIRYRWAAQDCMTLDGIPYIGKYGKRCGEVYVATGFNKWGMTSSMVSALILKEQIQGRKSPYDAVFAPDRSIMHPQLIKNGWEASINLLSFQQPRCPHLGCALQWNKQEHSWDCPCHGSRFGSDGTLLDGPATGDMHPEK